MRRLSVAAAGRPAQQRQALYQHPLLVVPPIISAVSCASSLAECASSNRPRIYTYYTRYFYVLYDIGGYFSSFNLIFIEKLFAILASEQPLLPGI